MKKRPPQVVITKQRTVHTYSELWHASKCLLDMGKEDPEGSYWKFLSSTLLTAFTFEAYLNHVGAVTLKCWSEIDRLPPWSKFELLCEELGVEFPEGAGVRPLQTISKLLDFRNTLAHGRSEELKSQPIMRSIENYHSAHSEQLLTNWERLIQSEEFPTRAREDVRSVLERLHEARRDEKEPLFSFGSGLHGASLVEEP